MSRRNTTNSPLPMQEMGALEQSLFEQGHRSICGVDEAGRGPLAGPVVAAAVVLPRDCEILGINDSKALTRLRREDIFEQLAESSIPCSIGIMNNDAIDTMNILRASLMAMRKAVMDLKVSPDVVLVDGNFAIPKLSMPQYAVIKGDSRCKAIAAASILAKVTRDRIMEKYEALYPSFSFATHKGYSTADHLRELKEHGPTDIHRRSFRPIAELLEQYELSF